MNTKIPHLLYTINFLILLKFLIGSSELDQTCNNTFTCGNTIRDIGYPFRGMNDPLYCGYPSLVLKCDYQHNVTTMDISNTTYIVLEIYRNTQTIRIIRPDLLELACPQRIANTTIDHSIFDYAATCTNLTLLYGCPDYVHDNLTFRSIPGCGNGVYVVPGNQNPGICNTSVIVPVLGAANGSIGNLQEGFEIRWKIDGKACSDCVQSNGRCGFDYEKNHTRCVCPNPLHFADTCSISTANIPSPGNGSTHNKIGLSIAGAVVAAVGLGWLIFFLRQRKKQRCAAKSALIVTKEISPSFSSKRLLTSSTVAFTKSIPSYPSSDSDFGRINSHSSYFGAQIFDYAELQEVTDNFNASRELGDGGFGAVYYGELHDGRKVAVKRLYENNFRRVEQFMNEVEILTRLSHQNLVKLYGCTSRQSRELLLVYEYIKNGTVADHLHGNRAKSRLLSWPIRLNIAIETAEALAYLHKSDIIHRDVKTTNILLANDFHVKVADFGLSRLFPTNVTHVSTAPQGTPGYVDPEYYQCYQLTEKSDVYSFGVILIELISSLEAVDTSRHRHDINLSNMAKNKIQNHALHELLDSNLGFEINCSAKRMATLVAELAFRCLQQERAMRPSMDEVLEELKRIRDQDINACKVDILMEDDNYAEPLNGVVGPPLSDSSSSPHSSG